MRSKLATMVTAAAVIAVCILQFSCSKENKDDELRKKENKLLNEYLNKTTLTFYKALKVALRSTSDPAKNVEIAKASATILRLGTTAISLLPNEGDSAKTLSFVELFSMVKDFYAARDILIKTDEDSLPTILENI